MDTALAAACEATWPATEYAKAGGFSVGRGLGAGGRVSSARAIGDWQESDIDAVIAVHQHWQQAPLFRVVDDEQRLIVALEARGFQCENPTVVMETATVELATVALPRGMASSIWPPSESQRDIWAAGNIGPQRQAVMERVKGAKAAILGQVEGCSAGAAFAAIAQGVAMVHCVEVLPDWQRRGVASRMMHQAALWAAEQGASRLALAVGRENMAAIALYRRLGLREVAGYRYYSPPEGEI
ncbi:GNAT family N-acetyltransferase [Halomonas binhaiensis]|uniref:GNAT family N-acetyltransferase n=1 Tax=Halomonas binhaiensis TaxID=2562282 RepID=A0A5C1NDP2_9GAMM|nr:GNAT family N-acetyltransferase [Halomonas binhaiensis]QEM81000.1 GNAT family N-acetyltransferase [Halomonas binhaiensis]